MIVCPECGAKIIIDAEFCHECGKKILNQNENVKMNTKTEKSLAKRNKSQKKPKYPIISTLDTITNIFLILLVVSLAIIILSVIISYFTHQTYQNIYNISIISMMIFVAIFLVSSTISNKLKGCLRKKIMKVGIPTHAHILEVKSLEYNIFNRTETAELILKVYPKTDDPYQAKSTVKADLGDASHVFPPGSTVQVFIEPEDARQVEVKY